MMTNVFSDKEKESAKKEKSFLFWTWFAGLMAVLVLDVVLVVVALYRVEVLRDRDYTILLGVIAGFVSMAYACYSLFFFAIKFRLTRKFVRMLRDMDRGLKDTFEGKFICYEDALSTKDGVYFYTMVLKTRPLRRDDIDERKLLIEHTIPKLELEEGTKLRLVSHANILVSYEILAHPKTETTQSETEEQ